MLGYAGLPDAPEHVEQAKFLDGRKNLSYFLSDQIFTAHMIDLFRRTVKIRENKVHPIISFPIDRNAAAQILEHFLQARFTLLQFPRPLIHLPDDTSGVACAKQQQSPQQTRSKCPHGEDSPALPS